MSEPDSQLVTFQESRSLPVGFLLSAGWWRRSFLLSFAVLRHFLVVSVIFALSNALTAYADYTMRTASMDFIQVDLPSLTNLGIRLGLSTTLSLVLGLISLSIFLEKLTAFSRLALFDCSANKYIEAKKEVDAKKGYIAAVWMVGVLYLFLPIIPASVCMAFRILSNSQFNVMGEPLIHIPTEAILPLNISEIACFTLALAYCGLLTVISSGLTISAGKSARLAASLLLNHFGPIIFATCFVALLNVLISAPITVYLLYFAPPTQRADLSLLIISQLWFGVSSSLAWPLSILVFVELLRKNFQLNAPEKEENP